MKNKTCIATVAAMIIMSVTNVNCGKDGGDGFFIPILDNTWSNKDDNSNTFFFLVDNDSTNTSTFDGNENPIGGGSQNHFSGSFTNHDIQFTYDNNSGSKSGKTYSGTINDASNVITLHSNDLGDLVLEKQ